MDRETLEFRPSQQPPSLPGRGAAGETSFDLLARAGEGDRRRLRVALGAALAAHVALFAVDFPEAAAEAFEPAARPRVYVVEQVRFKPPEPEPPEEIPQERRHVVPIPDPTPGEPEPIRTYQEVAPRDLDLPVPEVAYIPDAPPAPPAEPEGPLPVGGEVTRPVKISGPVPVYSELARRARIQGAVMVRAIIDRDGRVTDLKLIRDLPMGLGDATMAAVRRWRFTPGTLRGKPVPVLYDLTVTFDLQ